MLRAAPGRIVRLLVLASALLAPPPLAAQEDDRSLHWRELAVEARLDADGRLHVRERQAIVFDGAWNGAEREFDLRLGQELRLHSLTRVDPRTGERTSLVPGELEAVDEFDWVDGETLRWRSRLESDPPFQGREIVYELEYTLWPVLVPSGEGGYQLRHDFAFPDRAGMIERFEVDLTLDPAWGGHGAGRIRETAEQLPPGRGYTVTLPLRFVGPGEPGAVPRGAPGAVRGLVALGALLVPLLLLLVLRRRARELDRVAPLTPPESITPRWLREHLFALPPEVVGTAWDRAVGKAEVAALLARLVEEGKLSSRVETDGGDPVLHLRREAPLSAFADHERELLEGLFFDGGDRTDTAAIRAHYKDKGFDPAAPIRKALEAQLDALPGSGERGRAWMPGAAVLVVSVLTILLSNGWGSAAVIVVGLVAAAIVTPIALPSASALSRRVTHRTAPAAGVLLPVVGGALLLAMLASGRVEAMAGMELYRPDAQLLLGFLGLLAGVGLLAAVLSRPTETVERLALRRRLVSAREFFEHELSRPSPRLEDAWFPYLLAFGLGPHVDRWFRAFGSRAAATTTASPGVLTAGRGSGGQTGGWTGGGPQFGGGSGGGGGWGGAWGVAAADLASGVSAPSSSGGGGGGGSSSGGGGGGGW